MVQSRLRDLHHAFDRRLNQGLRIYMPLSLLFLVACAVLALFS
ncbi:MAG: hypothetical protein ACI9F9_001173 [Candidatus Paceibacteria bacterium]|jgi:hypothetical protein